MSSGVVCILSARWVGTDFVLANNYICARVESLLIVDAGISLYLHFNSIRGFRARWIIGVNNIESVTRAMMCFRVLLETFSFFWDEKYAESYSIRV